MNIINKDYFISERCILKFLQEEQLLNLLKDQIDKNSLSKEFAALDADGTLWMKDANYSLLKYEIEKGLRDLGDLLDPRYREEGYRYKRCELLAQGQAGWTLEELEGHCVKALKARPLHVFPFQRKLLTYLKHKGMKVVIVTASLKWLVEQAVRLYNLPVDQVLGVETQLEGGRIGSELVLPAPLATFKGAVFLNYSQGKKCFLAGGNTCTDLPLLEMAEVSFTVHSADPENEIFSSEKRLTQLAIQNNWIVFKKQKEIIKQ